MLNSGYVQVYTGNGKGKTTAALGLAIRAVGAGFNVFIAQFAKQQDCSELIALATYFPRLQIRQYGSGNFITGAPSEDDIACARRGWAVVNHLLGRSIGNDDLVSREQAKDKDTVQMERIDLLILDEIAIANFYGMVQVEEVLEFISYKRANFSGMEIVLTGRNADHRIIAAADLVTEMKEVKHYYRDHGVVARIGIEK